MESYLITGAAGFIGSAVAKKYIDLGHKVTTIDNLKTGYISAIPAGVRFIQGDCQDKKLIESLQSESFTSIIHIAGQSSGEISFEDPVYDLATNTESTLLLLELARKIECKKFIYASTMSVYGQQPDQIISETTSTIPKSFYAVGKLASENYLRIYNQEYGLACTALRLFNVYGAGQNLENLKQGMVSIFLAQALKNKHIMIKGSRDRFRDFVYIDDVVDAFVKAEKHAKDKFMVYNVASGVRTTVEYLINKLVENLSFDIEITYSQSTPGDQFGIYGDYTRVSKELGWKPSISINEGIIKMVAWAKKAYR